MQEWSEVTGNRASARQTSRSQAVTLSSLRALPIEPQGSKVGALPWQLPKALTHTIYRCLFYTAMLLRQVVKAVLPTETNTGRLPN